MEKVKKLHGLVERYYNDPRREWDRHQKHGSMEFLTSLRLLYEYLPKTGLILDAGAGPGRYAVELAKKGYKVILLDPSKPHLDFAKKIVKKYGLEKQVIGIIKGRVEDLSAFKNSTFDAVICLGGPLSHIMNEKLRKRAASELLRVAKKGAPVFVSVMIRLAIVRGGLVQFQDELLAPYFKTWLKTGDYSGGYGFTPMHGFMPEELKKLFRQNGARSLRIFALEGFSSREDRAVKQLLKDKRRWNVWMKTHFAVIDRPEVLGVSDHFMLVCNK